MSEPRGYQRLITDAELRQRLEAGKKAPEIAAEFGVTRQSIYQRIKRLGITTVAAVVAPEESRRYTARTIDALEELVGNRDVLHKFLDACERELSDPNDPGRYFLGPRAHEVEVVFETIDEDDSGKPKRVKRKALLSALIAEIEGDSNAMRHVTGARSTYADPRQLLLSAVSEIRATVNAAADIARMLADARAMQAFRDAMIAEISRVSPEVAESIANAVRRSILLANAAGGFTALPAASGPDAGSNPGT